MKQIITFLFMCLVAIAANAQHKAEIEVSYDWTSFNRNGHEITRQMTLLAGQTFSKFYDAAGEYVMLTHSGQFHPD